MKIKANFYLGILLCTLLGLSGIYLSKIIPNIGSVTIAMILGMITGNLIKDKSMINQGVSFFDKKILPFTIALLGAGLQGQILINLGIKGLLFIFILLVTTIVFSIYIGKLFNMSRDSSILLGCGNAVCGSSAIVSVSKVLDSDPEDTALAITAVNFMGILGIFLLPFLANTINLDENKTAHLIGGILQAVGQVVASGFSLNEEIGQLAVIIKMGRVLLLGPIIIVIGIIFNKGNKSKISTDAVRKKQIPIPLFIIGFFLLALLSTFNLLNPQFQKLMFTGTKFLLPCAMAAIGIKIDFRIFKTQGIKLFFTESLIFAVQIITSILLFFILKI